MKIHIPADFTLQELEAFIEGERQESIEGFYTAAEWAEHFQINVRLMRQILKRAKERGLLKIMHVERLALDDRIYRVPAYALIKQNDEEKT